MKIKYCGKCGKELKNGFCEDCNINGEEYIKPNYKTPLWLNITYYFFIFLLGLLILRVINDFILYKYSLSFLGNEKVGYEGIGFWIFIFGWLITPIFIFVLKNARKTIKKEGFFYCKHCGEKYSPPKFLSFCPYCGR